MVLRGKKRTVYALPNIINPDLHDYINAGVITPADRNYDPRIDKPLAIPGRIDLLAQLLQDRAPS